MAENTELAITDLPSNVQLEDHESSNVSPGSFIIVGCTLHIALQVSALLKSTSNLLAYASSDLPVWSEFPDSQLARGQGVEV